MAKVKKITITPVAGLPQPYWDDDDFSLKDLPFDVGSGVYIADVSEQTKSADYTLWAREYLSKHDVERIQKWHYALIHYYDEEQYFHGEVQENSRELVHRAFISLRIVRPSWTPYQYLHAEIKPDGSLDPSGFSQAAVERLTVPSCDGLTPVRRKDAELLKIIFPGLLHAYQSDCEPVKRAVRILELGYISESVDVKQLMWTTGLDSLFTSARKWGSPLATQRIQYFLGAETSIYQQSDFHSFVQVPSLTVKDVLPDIYKLRNKFAHGE